MLSEHFIRKRIHRNLNRRTARHLPFRHAAVLTDEHFPVDKLFLKKLSALTGIAYEHIDTLYVSRKEVHPEFVTVLDGHIGWTGKLKEPNINRFFEKDYDLLVDLSTLDSLRKKLISSGIRAGFRIGVTAEPDFYDLIIACRRDPEVFLRELEKYFRALGFIR